MGGSPPLSFSMPQGLGVPKAAATGGGAGARDPHSTVHELPGAAAGASVLLAAAAEAAGDPGTRRRDAAGSGPATPFAVSAPDNGGGGEGGGGDGGGGDGGGGEGGGGEGGG